MQISQISNADLGRAPQGYPGGVVAATAALYNTSGSINVDHQLSAYHALANRWTQAGRDERASLAPALNDSPFAKTIQSALNTFTRAAWPGAGAVPPAPQRQALDAFDALSDTHKAIVASLQVGIQEDKGPGTVADYRASLQSELDKAQAPSPEPRDSISLSAEAQAKLAGASIPEAESVVAASPEMAAAINAYGKASR